MGSFTTDEEPLHLQVIKFIEVNINFFINDYATISNEKGLNQQFVICMNNCARDKLFIFHHEYIENILSGISSQVDIGIIRVKDQKAFFVLEAKRLDTTLKKYREREYIVANKSNGGGIERFKRDKHGKGLTLSGMIGYIQTDDFDIWKDKINSWIDEEIENSSSYDLSWLINDKLTEESQNIKIAKYTSIHNRISKTQINLTHLWIKLN